MVTRSDGTGVFVIKDCALTSIAIGQRAQNLRELRDNLLTVHPGSIYYHFWGGLLRPSFVEPEYNNDFAAWAYHGLHDRVLAERLAVINPTDFDSLEDLRHELIDVIEERLDEVQMIPWAKADQQFYFVRPQIVVFDTHHSIREPEELADLVPRMSISSIYYHFIEARRRMEKGTDDFRAWLSGFKEDYSQLIRDLSEIDPYFSSLTELRDKLTTVFHNHFSRKG